MAVGVAAVIFEILLKIFIPAPENLAKLQSSSDFLHENKKNVVFRHTSSEFDNEISINSHGFRDSEFYKEKAEGVFRIAVLGDSQEEALQVALADTWQKVMTKKLSEGSGSKVETYNFGVSGYGTDQQWLTLREKVWQFAPDLVILAFSPNDVGDTYKNKLVRIKDNQIEVITNAQRAGGNFLGKLARQTYTYHLIIRAASSNVIAKRAVDKVRTKILGFSKEEKFFLSDAQLVQGPFEVIASQKNPPSEVAGGWKLVKALIFDMGKQAKDHEAKFMITINIPRAQVLPSDWEILQKTYNLDPQNSSPYEINEVLAKIAVDLGILFYDPRLDAISWMKENGDLHLKADGHFNKNGNLFMGIKVAEFIENAGSVKR